MRAEVQYEVLASQVGLRDDARQHSSRPRRRLHHLAAATRPARHLICRPSHGSGHPGHTIQGVGSMPVMGWGNIKILLSVNGKTSKMTLTDVIHAPQIEFNLLSIPCIVNGLFDIHFRT